MQALADLSGLQISSGDAAEALSSDSRDMDAVEGSQAATSNAVQAHPAREGRADAASGNCKKPGALFLAYYNQVSIEHLCLDLSQDHPLMKHNPLKFWLPDAMALIRLVSILGDAA